tara:strand:+ start:28666 stop:30087 length:1422 start_codon:yes stop_codon:yes gene_type:complete
MVVRSYFDKNNTLVYNQNVNTGKNPVAELFYGGVWLAENPLYSRYIFKLDVDRLKAFYDSGMYPELTGLTHTLRMTNTSTFDSSLLGTETGDGKDRTSSFNLNLFAVDQEWDEGVGYDFTGQKYFSSSDATILSNAPSNWIEAQIGTNWPSGSGVYTGSTSSVTLVTQHFSDGNENLEMDVTNIVNAYLTGGTNYGLGLAFDDALEAAIEDNLKYVGFFTRHTQTFYEPYLESKYNSTILDNRGNFYLDKLNKLYLYVNVGGIPTNVDSITGMTVTVNDNTGTVFSSFTSNDITHETKGVYSIELLVPTTDVGCVLYEDVWSGIVINGVTRPDIELDFELKSSDEYYNIGSDSSIPKNYTFNVSGIKDKERINRGDIRKVRVMARVPYSVNQQEVLDSLEYRLYIREGKAEYTVIDYTPVELAFNYNYFLLDTASLVPQRYYLDVKATSSYEVTTTKKIISFDITSQVDERKG